MNGDGTGAEPAGQGRRAEDLTGQVAVVTGATSGIGFETAAALAQRGATVVVTGRDAERTETARGAIASRTGGDVRGVSFDLGSLGDVRRGAEALLDIVDSLNVLVNNAGLVLSERRMTQDGFEATFATNHLGPFLLTNLLLKRLRESGRARVVNVASTAHSSARRGLDFDDLQSERRYRPMAVYGRSKLANILFTRELARRLSGSSVTANCLHPGTVATGFARDGDASGLLALGVRLIKPFVLTPAEGAKTSIYLAASPEVEGVTGEYFIKCRPAKPSKAARDDEAARRLWATSAQLVGLDGPSGP